MPQTTVGGIWQSVYCPVDHTSLHRTQACSATLLQSSTGLHEHLSCHRVQRYLGLRLQQPIKSCELWELWGNLKEGYFWGTEDSIELSASSSDSTPIFSNQWQADTALERVDYLWMTGQLRREYSGWPSLKSVTLIMFCAKMSAQQTVWDHWGKGVHPTVMYLQINSNVSSKKKSSSIQEQGWRFGAGGGGYI